MPEGSLSIRPMQLADFAVRVADFHEATDEHLTRLGVERSLLPNPGEWLARFASNLALPLQQRPEYGVGWKLDDTLVGFSTADQIQFGVEAHMHLHTVDPERRAAGLGSRFVRLTPLHYCEVLRLARL